MRSIQINHHQYRSLIMPSAAARKPVANSQADASTVASRPRPAGFDYGVEAELFPTHNRKSKRAAFGYRRFSRAADAIRFAIEQLPSDALAGAYLEVREQRFDRHGIQRLYDSEAYPLPRRKASS
jgi:hypothetical protein